MQCNIQLCFGYKSILTIASIATFLSNLTFYTVKDTAGEA